MRAIYILILLAGLAFTAMAWGQPIGTIHGTVYQSDGNPADHAFVRLAGTNHHGSPHHAVMTDFDGHFSIINVLPGRYTLMAMMRGAGHAMQRVQLNGGETLTVTMTLARHDSGMHHDSLTTVTLEGLALVFPPDSSAEYRGIFLDADWDYAPEYRLSFGPRRYNPPSGAQRPQTGDTITIVGGLLGYGEIPTVVVYQINGLTWRDPLAGHGGWAGDRPFVYHYCDGRTDTSHMDDAANPPLVGMFGDFWLAECDPDPNPNGIIALCANCTDYVPTHYMNFGAAFDGSYFRSAFVVGALLRSPNNGIPWIIVYEMDGMFVREPGDDEGLDRTISAVEEPASALTPKSHVVAGVYPNPFNPVTMIEYTIPAASRVDVTIFDISGREVTPLVNAEQNAGTYRVAWDGSAAPSGIYLYRVNAGGAIAAGRMVLLK